jgi:8-oxo-dGTP pyrophosphatase MutT (NUDIX family)
VSLGKAGFIPYVIERGLPIFMFMVPSDPRYGGELPQIAKGSVDEGESKIVAAIREAEEELGLRKSNIKNNTIKLVLKNNHITIYMGEVKNKEAFDKPHFETDSVHWLSAEEFKEKGRGIHKFAITQAANLLNT